MPCPNPTDRERDPASPNGEDAKVERAVLAFLLDEHPNRLALPEVAWAMNPRDEMFAEDAAVERAVRELVGAGLLLCAGGFVLPTCPALYFHRLEQD